MAATPQGKPTQANVPDSFSTYAFVGSEMDADPGGETSRANYQLSKRMLRQTFATLREYCSNHFQNQLFTIIRNPKKIEELKTTVTFQIYREFIADVLNNVYTKHYQLLQLGCMLSEMESELKFKFSRLSEDFFSSDNMITITSLSELIDKISQSEILNALCFSLLNFEFPINLRLSSLALAISFDNYKKLQLKQDQETTYKKSTLPKLTYINFNGLYSQLDIHLLCEYSDNVQIIMIYDKNTGGPIAEDRIPEDPRNEAGIDCSTFDSVAKISKNILLLPLECSEGKVDSKSIYNLFTNTINRAVRKFDPETVLITHSFNFQPEEPFNQAKKRRVSFSLKASTWTKILHDLCVAVNYKVIVFPSKPCYEPNINNEAITSSGAGIDKWKLKKSDEETLLAFSHPWNPSYLEDCFIGSLEVLSGNKKFKRRRKMQGTIMKSNHQFEIMINKVLKHYANSSLYSHLYSEKAEEALAISKKQFSDFISSIEGFIRNNPSFDYDVKKPFIQQDSKHEKPKTINKIKEIYRSHVSNEILVFDKNKLNSSTKNIHSYTRNLTLMYDEKTPLFPRKESQYIVDYASNSIYYFNILFENNYCHFEFKIDANSPLSFLNKKDNNFTSTALEKGKNTRFDMGLCIGGDKVFCVYGRNFDLECSDNISYFDTELREWVRPRIHQKSNYTETEEKFFPRHSVTCNYFRSSSMANAKHFLYVFGGISDQINTSKKWRIWNHVEFYIMDFEAKVFEFRSVSRKNLFNERVAWIPYTYSYSLEIKGEILILGGQRNSTSSIEAASLSNFRYSIEKECFLKTEIAELEGSRKSLVPKRDQEQELAIADVSRNVFDDGENIFIISRCSQSEHLISKISGTPTKPVVETFHCVCLNTALVINPSIANPSSNSNKAVNNPISDSGTRLQHYQYEDDDDKQAIQTFVNTFQAEKPEVRALLYYLAKYLQTFFERKSSNLSSDVFFEALYRIFTDQLFKEGEFKKLIKPVCQIFPMLAQDSRTKHLIAGVSDLLSLKSQELMRKTILQNKSKDKLLTLMQTLIRQMIAQKELKIQTVLSLERVFQRNRTLKEYHIPEYNHLTIKWFCKDFRDLFSNQSNTQANTDYSQEDLGVLRDCIECLGKLLVNAKRNGRVQQFEIAELEKEIFWNDKDQNQLSQRPIDQGQSNLNNPIYVNFGIHPLNESVITALLIELLAELAKREGIDFNQVIEVKEVDSTIEDKTNKWRQLAINHPKIFIAISSRLGSTVDEDHLTQITTQQTTDIAIQISDETKVTNSLPKGESQNVNITLLLEGSTDKENDYSIDKSIALESYRLKPAEGEERKQNDSNRKSTLDLKKGEKLVMEKANIPLSVKRPINYHCKLNLEESNKFVEMNKYHILLNSAGSHIICAHTHNNLIGARIMIYDPNCNRMEPLYLDTHQRSSLIIWNASSFLYLDSHMASRLSRDFKDDLENCLLYTDLRQSCLLNGQTKGLAIFYPLFRTTNKLMERAVIADESGIYLIGGSKISWGKKRNFLLSNECNFYELNVVLQGFSTGQRQKEGQEEEKQISIPKIEGGMPSMSLKRTDLTISQIKGKIFVTDRTTHDSQANELIIEVFDKDSFSWVGIIKVPITYSPICTYQLTTINLGKDVQKIAIFENEIGRNPTGYAIEEDTYEIVRLQEKEILEVTSESTL